VRIKHVEVIISIVTVYTHTISTAIFQVNLSLMVAPLVLNFQSFLSWASYETVVSERVFQGDGGLRM